MYSDSAIVTPTGEVSALRVETHRVNIALCVLCVCVEIVVCVCVSGEEGGKGGWEGGRRVCVCVCVCVEIVVRWCVSVCVCAYWRRRKGSKCDDLVR